MLLPSAKRDSLARPALFSMVLALSCAGPSPSLECRQAALRSGLSNGSALSNYVYLDTVDAQALLGLHFRSNDGWCSGTMVGPTSVLTAAHCVDPRARNSGEPLELELVSNGNSLGSLEVTARFHDTLDVALLLIAGPGLETAIPRLRLTDSRRQLGELMQIQGYGYDDRNALGNLSFAVSSVVSFDETSFVLGTDGENGLCGGDSGAAALTRDASGSIVIAGVLSSGTVNCRGTDVFVSGAAFKTWAEDIIRSLPGPETEPESAPRHESLACARLGGRGRCFGQVAVWCEDDALKGLACGDDAPCGWHPASSGFRCVPSSRDPCAGYSDLGACVEGAARVCEDGILRESPCGACNARCSRESDTGRARCSVSL